MELPVPLDGLPPELVSALEDAQPGALDTVRILELFMGQDQHGRDFYAYMAILPSRYLKYKSLLAHGEALDPGDYGDVVEHGFTPLPPANVQEDMEKRGFSPALGDDVRAKLIARGAKL